MVVHNRWFCQQVTAPGRPLGPRRAGGLLAGRQAEAGQQRGFEAGHRLDAAAGEAEYQQTVCLRGVGPGWAQVGAEGELAVGPGGDEARRQQLDRGDEGQRDRFVRLVPGLGPRFGAGKAFKQVIGAGFEPGDLAQLGRLGWRGTGQRTCPPAAASRSPRIQAARGDHPVQPGPDRGAFLEAAQPLPGRQQRVLQGILGVVDRPQHPVAVHLQLSLVRADKLAERLPIARPARSSSSPVTATSLHTRAPAAHPVTDHR